MYKFVETRDLPVDHIANRLPGWHREEDAVCVEFWKPVTFVCPMMGPICVRVLRDEALADAEAELARVMEIIERTADQYRRSGYEWTNGSALWRRATDPLGTFWIRERDATGKQLDRLVLPFDLRSFEGH